jgi:hypothetical protein
MQRTPLLQPLTPMTQTGECGIGQRPLLRPMTGVSLPPGAAPGGAPAPPGGQRHGQSTYGTDDALDGSHLNVSPLDRCALPRRVALRTGTMAGLRAPLRND